MTTVGVARLERLDAKDGQGSRGWGWHRDADPSAAAPGWRDQRWVDWARVAGAQRSSGGAIVVAHRAEGAFVASLEPERTVVVGPLDASLAEAISLRGQAVWSAEGVDLDRIEAAVAGVPAATPSLVPQIEALLSVLWGVPAHPSVLVVDLDAGSPWVEAFRVVAELVGLTSVAVGAGRVLDDRPMGAEVQLVDSEVAARWSQASGSYPVLRSDATLPRSADAVAMTAALVHAGSARALRNAARRSGAADGSWAGLKAWFADRVSRFGAVPMLAGEQLPQDSLRVIAATPEGRAWLIEDALGAGAAWAVRADAAQSFASLGQKDSAAFAALRDASLAVWSTLTATAERMLLVERLGQHLATADELTRFIQQTFDLAPESERAEVAHWAGQLGHGLDAASPQVQALLAATDPSELPELIGSLANPLALAQVVSADAPWARVWFGRVDGAFAAATSTDSGTDAVIDLALADPTFASGAGVGSLDDAQSTRLIDAVKRRDLAPSGALEAMVTRVVRPLLGEETSVGYFTWLVRQRRHSLLGVVDAARSSALAWAPTDEQILIALNESQDDVEALLDLGPSVEPLQRYIQGGMNPRWAAAWLRRPDTIRGLMVEPSGTGTLIDLATKDPAFLNGERGDVCRSELAMYRPTADRWVKRAQQRIGGPVPIKNALAVIERACLPVLPQDRLDDLLTVWLGGIQGPVSDADLYQLMTWLSAHAPRLDALPELVKIARSETRRSGGVISVLVRAGASLEDLLPPGSDTAILQTWVERLGPDDRAFAEELVRYFDRHPFALAQIDLSDAARTATDPHRSLRRILARNAVDPRDGLEMMLGSDDAHRYVDRLVQPVLDEQRDDRAVHAQQIAEQEQTIKALREAAAASKEAAEQAEQARRDLADDIELERAANAAAAEDFEAQLAHQRDLLALRDATIAGHPRAVEEAVQTAVASARAAVPPVAAEPESGTNAPRSDDGDAGGRRSKQPAAARASAVKEERSTGHEAPAPDDGESTRGHASDREAASEAVPAKAGAGRIALVSIAGGMALAAFLIAGFVASWTAALGGAATVIGLVAGTASVGRLLYAPRSFRRGIGHDRESSPSTLLLILSLLSLLLAVIAVGWSGLAWWAALALAIPALVLAVVVALGVERRPPKKSPREADDAASGAEEAAVVEAADGPPVASSQDRHSDRDGTSTTPEKAGPPKRVRPKSYVLGRLFAGRTPLVDAKAITVFVVAALAVAGLTNGGSATSSAPEKSVVASTTQPPGDSTEGNGGTPTSEPTGTTAPTGDSGGTDGAGAAPGPLTRAEVSLPAVTAWSIPVQDIERQVKQSIAQTGANPATADVRLVVVYGTDVTVVKGIGLAQEVVKGLQGSAYFSNTSFESSAGGGTPGSAQLVVYFDP